MAKTLEELQVYVKAVAAAGAISGITERHHFGDDRKLRDQIRACADGIPAQIAEGFGQKTDKHFSHFLAIARGECNEVRTHLEAALRRNRITPTEHADLCEQYVVIGKMITNLMKHLDKDQRTQRG
jgi:four helix bundle protein